MKPKSIRPSKQKKAFHRIVKAALKEDIGRGDITTDAIVAPQVKALGIIFPKKDGILCGIDIAQMVFQQVDETIDFQTKVHDGEGFAPGVTLATIIGSAASCLKAERTALNFLQHLSGIATLTRRFVTATEGKIKLLDTRKTLPGLRIVEKYAVRTGGGYNHRFGLYDMVLIKDNHIEIAGSLTNAVKAVRQRRKRVFIEVEVKTLNELHEALTLKINRIMLDNMNPTQVQEAVQIIRGQSRTIEIELSGGVTQHNILDYVDCGVDYVSVGALTHSAPAIDITMHLKSLGHGES